MSGIYTMSIVQNTSQYDINNVYFCDSIKNNVMINGTFIRILYCLPNFTMNGVYIHMLFTDLTYEKYYQKYKCDFNVDKCAELVASVVDIEKTILDKIAQKIENKTPQYKIAEQLTNGYLKIYSSGPPKGSSSSFLLKISGIWETDNSYGLTYKFSKVVGL